MCQLPTDRQSDPYSSKGRHNKPEAYLGDNDLLTGADEPDEPLQDVQTRRPHHPLPRLDKTRNLFTLIPQEQAEMCTSLHIKLVKLELCESEHLHLKDEVSIGIIYQPWLTKTPIMVSLSLIGYKLLSGQGLYAPVHCDLDL